MEPNRPLGGDPHRWQNASVPLTFGNGDRRDHSCILVVDDEADIVDFLAVLLEDEGFTVLRAYDGQQAWELALAAHPKLVISDVMMPRMTGLELLDHLRGSADALSRTPVILMSAVGRRVERESVTFVPKPFDIDRMLSLVTTELAAD